MKTIFWLWKGQSPYRCIAEVMALIVKKLTQGMHALCAHPASVGHVTSPECGGLSYGPLPSSGYTPLRRHP